MIWYTPTAQKWQGQLSCLRGYSLQPQKEATASLLCPGNPPLPFPHHSPLPLLVQQGQWSRTRSLDSHKQSHACTISTQSGSQGPSKSGAVAIQTLSCPVYSGSQPGARVACAVSTTLRVSTWAGGTPVGTTTSHTSDRNGLARSMLSPWSKGKWEQAQLRPAGCWTNALIMLPGQRWAEPAPRAGHGCTRHSSTYTDTFTLL